MAVLLACARAGPAPPPRAALRRHLEAAIDWPHLLRAATRHALLPLLHRALAGVGGGGVPGDVLEELEHHFEATDGFNRVLAGELARLVAIFRDAGIPVLALKGPALAIQAYGDLRLRQFSDLDLLVRPGDATRARDLLLARRGYETQQLDPAEEAIYRSSAYAYRLLAFAAEVRLPIHCEVHWSLTPRYFAFPLGYEDLAAHAESVDVLDAEVAVPAPEDHLLVLAVHGARNRWARLSLIADVAALVEARPELDWERAFGRARARGGARMLRLALGLAAALLEASLPEAIARNVDADRAVAKLVAEARSRLFAAPGDAIPGGGDAPYLGYYVRVRERWRDRARIGLRLLLEPRLADARFVALPEALRFLYPAVRVARLGARLARRAPRRSRRPTSHLD